MVWTKSRACRGASPPSALPGISPSRGEIDKRLAPCLWNARGLIALARGI
ncbi:hypothetical protein GH784_18730 [Agrobacterium sp. CNPSo 675]|nr:hypothetical protein [Agrobacterium tumefaciens]